MHYEYVFMVPVVDHVLRVTFQRGEEGEKREEKEESEWECVLSFRLELDQVVPWACDEPCSE